MTVGVVTVIGDTCRLTATDDREAGDGSTPNGPAAPARTKTMKASNRYLCLTS